MLVEAELEVCESYYSSEEISAVVKVIKQFQNCRVNVRLGQPGAFEVRVRLKNDAAFYEVHSQLATKKLPVEDVLRKRINLLLKKNEQQMQDMGIQQQQNMQHNMMQHMHQGNRNQQMQQMMQMGGSMNGQMGENMNCQMNPQMNLQMMNPQMSGQQMNGQITPQQMRNMKQRQMQMNQMDPDDVFFEEADQFIIDHSRRIQTAPMRCPSISPDTQNRGMNGSIGMRNGGLGMNGSMGMTGMAGSMGMDNGMNGMIPHNNLDTYVDNVNKFENSMGMKRGVSRRAPRSAGYNTTNLNGSTGRIHGNGQMSGSMNGNSMNNYMMAPHNVKNTISGLMAYRDQYSKPKQMNYKRMVDPRKRSDSCYVVRNNNRRATASRGSVRSRGAVQSRGKIGQSANNSRARTASNNGRKRMHAMQGNGMHNGMQGNNLHHEMQANIMQPNQHDNVVMQANQHMQRNSNMQGNLNMQNMSTCGNIVDQQGMYDMNGNPNMEMQNCQSMQNMQMQNGQNMPNQNNLFQSRRSTNFDRVLQSWGLMDDFSENNVNNNFQAPRSTRNGPPVAPEIPQAPRNVHKAVSTRQRNNMNSVNNGNQNGNQNNMHQNNGNNMQQNLQNMQNQHVQGTPRTPRGTNPLTRAPTTPRDMNKTGSNFTKPTYVNKAKASPHKTSPSKNLQNVAQVGSPVKISPGKRATSPKPKAGVPHVMSAPRDNGQISNGQMKGTTIPVKNIDPFMVTTRETLSSTTTAQISTVATAKDKISNECVSKPQLLMKEVCVDSLLKAGNVDIKENWKGTECYSGSEAETSTTLKSSEQDGPSVTNSLINNAAKHVIADMDGSSEEKKNVKVEDVSQNATNAPHNATAVCVDEKGVEKTIESSDDLRGDIIVEKVITCEDLLDQTCVGKTEGSITKTAEEAGWNMEDVPNPGRNGENPAEGPDGLCSVKEVNSPAKGNADEGDDTSYDEDFEDEYVNNEFESEDDDCKCVVEEKTVSKGSTNYFAEEEVPAKAPRSSEEIQDTIAKLLAEATPLDEEVDEKKEKEEEKGDGLMKTSLEAFEKPSQKFTEPIPVAGDVKSIENMMRAAISKNPTALTPEATVKAETPVKPEPTMKVETAAKPDAVQSGVKTTISLSPKETAPCTTKMGIPSVDVDNESVVASQIKSSVVPQSVADVTPSIDQIFGAENQSDEEFGKGISLDTFFRQKDDEMSEDSDDRMDMGMNANANNSNMNMGMNAITNNTTSSYSMQNDMPMGMNNGMINNMGTNHGMPNQMQNMRGIHGQNAGQAPNMMQNGMQNEPMQYQMQMHQDGRGRAASNNGPATTPRNNGSNMVGAPASRQKKKPTSRGTPMSPQKPSSPKKPAMPAAGKQVNTPNRGRRTKPTANPYSNVPGANASGAQKRNGPPSPYKQNAGTLGGNNGMGYIITDGRPADWNDGMVNGMTNKHVANRTGMGGVHPNGMHPMNNGMGQMGNSMCNGMGRSMNNGMGPPMNNDMNPMAAGINPMCNDMPMHAGGHMHDIDDSYNLLSGPSNYPVRPFPEEEEEDFDTYMQYQGECDQKTALTSTRRTNFGATNTLGATARDGGFGSKGFGVWKDGGFGSTARDGGFGTSKERFRSTSKDGRFRSTSKDDIPADQMPGANLPLEPKAHFDPLTTRPLSSCTNDFRPSSSSGFRNRSGSRADRSRRGSRGDNLKKSNGFDADDFPCVENMDEQQRMAFTAINGGFFDSSKVSDPLGPSNGPDLLGLGMGSDSLGLGPVPNDGISVIPWNSTSSCENLPDRGMPNAPGIPTTTSSLPVVPPSSNTKAPIKSVGILNFDPTMHIDVSIVWGKTKKQNIKYNFQTHTRHLYLETSHAEYMVPRNVVVPCSESGADLRIIYHAIEKPDIVRMNPMTFYLYVYSVVSDASGGEFQNGVVESTKMTKQNLLESIKINATYCDGMPSRPMSRISRNGDFD